MTAISYRQELLRKMIHLSSLWIPAFIYYFGQGVSVIFFAILTLLMFVFEVVRRQDHALARLVKNLFGRMLRDEENKGKWSFSGAFYMMLGACIVTALFSPQIATISMVMMLVGDVAAALIGRRFGKIRIFEKSLEGTLAFFITAVIAAAVPQLISQAFVLGVFPTLAGAAAAAVTELVTKKIRIDDNISVPIAAAAVMSLMTIPV